VDCMELFDRFGGGGNDVRAKVVVERIGFEDSGLGRIALMFCRDWIRDGGGLSKLLLVSLSEGRGGRTGFVASSCGEVGLRGRSGAISAGGCNPTPFTAAGFVILLGTGIGAGVLFDGGEYFRRGSADETNGEFATICGDRGGGSGGGGVFEIGSGVFGPCRSSCFGRIGRGDNGGFVVPTGVTTTVTERGGRDGLVDVAGGTTEDDSMSKNGLADGVCGESTVMSGCRDDADTTLRPSVRTVGVNCGDRGGPSAVLVVLSGGSIRGFALSLGGGCGEGTLAGRPSTLAH
jgi:hypothetical protein